MSAIAAFSLHDGAATPVPHAFNPQPDITSNVAAWVDRSGGIALGYPKVTFSMRMPSPASRAYKVVAKIVTPVLEVTSPSTASGIQPAPTLAYNLIFNMDFVLPERSTLQQRKDILQFARNWLAHAIMTSAIQDFEPVY